MPEASFLPPNPSRQDWGVFEPPDSIEPPQNIAGETEDERHKEAFRNIMQAAAYLFETDPHGLLDLVSLLGRAEQTRRMALPLSFPGNVPSDYKPGPDGPWFGNRKPLTETGKDFEDLAPQVETEVPERLTAADLMMPEPWSKEGLLHVAPKIGAGRELGPFQQDRGNHHVELWLPLRVAWVQGGNHSITAGILRAEVELTTNLARDLTPLYDHVGCDGEVFFRLHDGSTIDMVPDYEWAAIFEIGRYLSEARRRNRI